MTKKKRSFLQVLTGAKKSAKTKQKLKQKKSKKPTVRKKPKKSKKNIAGFERTALSYTAQDQQTEGQLTIDVFQTPDDIVIKSTIAGVDPKDLDITIVNDTLTIRGKREQDEKVQQQDYFYQECYWGNFSRSIILPMEVDADKIQAKLKNGILSIRLPKLAKTQPKKIQVISA